MYGISEHHDIIILGAGLSGINTAHVLREQLPDRKFTILEARSVVGGTWNLFTYPGIRCDSYMTTYGLKWYPWPYTHKFASGPEIAQYLEDAAIKDGAMDKIRFRHKVTQLEWSDENHIWTLIVDADGTQKTFAANFIFVCTGYFSQQKALDANIPGIKTFTGTVAHPQWWPQDLDYVGKRVVIIGSGATAYTMVPAMVGKAAHMTMLQRSPSYVHSMSTKSSLEIIPRFLLPKTWAHWLCWWKDMMYETILSHILIFFPDVGRYLLTKMAQYELPSHVDTTVHFNPQYKPLQQRLCVCPDGDFFQALHLDKCEVVTDVIENVTPDGILLKSGRKLPADIIVTATGLYFEFLNGLKPIVNGDAIDPGSQYIWRGVMLESMPNLGYILGYAVQSWTPGADAMAKMLVRVIRDMEKKKATKVMPVLHRWEGMPEMICLDTNSNYFLKAADKMPKVTGESPWHRRTHWIYDIWSVWFSNTDDGLVYEGGTDK